MNKKILYKLLLISVLLICILLISNTKSFASDETTTYESINLTFSTGKSMTFSNQTVLAYKNILILHSLEDDIYYKTSVYFSNDGAFSFAEDVSGRGYFLQCVKEDLTPVTFYSKTVTGKNMSFNDSINELNSATSFSTNRSYFSSTTDHKLTSFYYSSYDVLSFDQTNLVSTSDVLFSSTTGNGSFFQPPPQVQEQATTLAPIVEEVEAKKTLAEVVGILPLIIVVVVSLVGLRKALKMLLTVLNRA